MKKIFALAAGLTLLSACHTVESISISQLPEMAARKQKIASAASSLIILSIPFGSTFVAEAREGLLRQCPQGAIEGVLSKHETVSYFPGVAVEQRVSMEAYCINAKRKG